MSAYGNDNLLQKNQGQFLTVDGTSDTVTLNKNTYAVELYAAQNCWVTWGTAPTAVKPGAEKTTGDSFYLPASTTRIYPVPYGTDTAPIKLAAIQDSASGSLFVNEFRS